jgi:5'-3' exonuclease
MVKTITSVWSKEVDRTKYPSEQPNMKRFINQWLKRLKADLEIFLNAGVTPVYIFDGKSPPEKAACQVQRRQDRAEAKAQYDILLSQLMTMDDMFYGPYVEDLKKKAKRLYPCSSNIIGIMKEFFSVMGIPIIQCNEESERLCAQLCLSGYCSATYSEDRDVLVHGCPILITKMSGTIVYNGRSVGAVEIIDLYELLLGLGLSYRQFVDLCIMCGCDYNQRIKQVGPSRAYPMIVKYGSITAIPLADINKFFRIYIRQHPEDQALLLNPKQLLNMEACYHRFGPISVEELLSDYDRENDILLNLKINTQIGAEAAEFLASYQLDDMLGRFIDLYAFHPQIQNRDSLPITPPDITYCSWARFIVGVRYIEMWGV